MKKMTLTLKIIHLKQQFYILFMVLFSFIGCTGEHSNEERNDGYKITTVPFNQVKIEDNFWLPRIEKNREVTIPFCFAKCEETGRIANFVKAAKKEGAFGTKKVFDDTDLYKIIEGASYSLSVHSDPKLDQYLDSLIQIIGEAQEPDGYLYTIRTINPNHFPSADLEDAAGKERWVNESGRSHELYNSGHLFEAAAAHYQATHKTTLLKIALKNAELLTRVFGPGKRDDAPGHEIVEMGLVKLYRITGEKKYLDLAKFFIDCRGKENNEDKAYSQDHKPFVQQDEAVGHAVRAGYLYSGVADVAALTGNAEYWAAIDKIWENVVTKKLYLTGGIGASPHGEAFGANYELPNLTAYNETCAAIANVFWNYRMFLLHGDAKYIDVLERTLYNGLISGVGLDGKTFFYSNPLECDLKYPFNTGKLTRQPWFDCSCCPTNICRFIPSIPGYIYAKTKNKIFVNLFVQSSCGIDMDGDSVRINQQTNYPWQGNVKIGISTESKSPFSVCLRIPEWVVNHPVPSDLYTYENIENSQFSIKINGKQPDYSVKNGYVVLTRIWQKNDVIEYNLPITPRRVKSNKLVESDEGKVALERGPIVYCIEGIDNPNIDLLSISPRTQLTTSFMPNLLGGIEVIKGVGDSPDEQFLAIPYSVWNNRGFNKMKVWLPVSN